MIKLFVFDTNSLISAAILPKSISGRAFFRAVEKGLVLLSEETREELKSVLFRKKFDKYLPNISDRLEFVNSLSAASLLIKPNISINACRDSKDNKFLELAVTANASCIITGDNDLLVLHPFREIPILNASDFLSDF